MDSPTSVEKPYILGNGEGELERLERQSRYFDDCTEDLFRRAGLREGMRVLDIGCGTGDVSFLVAKLVGPTGRVLGVDSGFEAVSRAQTRAVRDGITNVRFHLGDIDTFVPDRYFDAVVGRLILRHLPEPATTLARLASLTKLGGLIVMQENNLSRAYAVPDVPLYRANVARVIETFRRAGVEPDMGDKLHSTFIAAGLPAPQLYLNARPAAGEPMEVCRNLSALVRSLLPVMTQQGIATAKDIGIDTLAARLRDEALSAKAVLFPPTLVGAWAKVEA